MKSKTDLVNEYVNWLSKKSKDIDYDEVQSFFKSEGLKIMYIDALQKMKEMYVQDLIELNPEDTKREYTKKDIDRVTIGIIEKLQEIPITIISYLGQNKEFEIAEIFKKGLTEIIEDKASYKTKNKTSAE